MLVQYSCAALHDEYAWSNQQQCYIGPSRHTFIFPIFLSSLPFLLFLSLVKRFVVYTFTQYLHFFFHVVPESNSILVMLTVTNKDCDDNPSEICEKIRIMGS